MFLVPFSFPISIYIYIYYPSITLHNALEYLYKLLRGVPGSSQIQRLIGERRTGLERLCPNYGSKDPNNRASWPTYFDMNCISRKLLFGSLDP